MYGFELRHGHRPHLFQIVVATRVRAEDVNDDVAPIHKYPVAAFFSFYQHRIDAGAFQHRNHAVGERADVPRAGGAGDNHAIGEIGFTAEVYRDDVFGFLGVKRMNNKAFEFRGSAFRDYGFANYGRSPFLQGIISPHVLIMP